MERLNPTGYKWARICIAGTLKAQCGYCLPFGGRIPDSGYPVIQVRGEFAFYHIYPSGVVDNNGRHAVAITRHEAVQGALLLWVLI